MLRATESSPFGDLISRRVPFVVPKYQRPYAWEEEEVTDFIRDLKELYERRLNDASHPKKHFFGGIVSVERFAPDLSDMGNAFDVVDGQQRIATIMLTISLLIRGMEELAQQADSAGDQEIASKARSYASTTRKSYLEYTEVVGSQTQERVRLMLSKADAAFFESLIKGHTQALISSRTSHERLQGAWNLIDKELIRPILDHNSLSYADKLDCFLALRPGILQDCYFIHISSDDISEAYRLFAILNDRGKTLSDGDLLRVYTLEMLEGHPVQQGHLEQRWDNILGHSYEEVRLFLRAYYPSYKGERAPSGDFVDKFREQFFNYTRPLLSNQAAELVMRVEQMQEEMDVFLDISEGNWPYENATVSLWERNRLFYLIKVLKHSLCIPLLMSACQGLPESEFARLVNLLDLFVFRYINMVGAHPGSLGSIYYKQAVAIRQKGSTYSKADLQTELARLQNANAADKLFEEAMRQKLNYKQAPRNTIRYFLTTIEYYFRWYDQGAKGRPIPDMSRVFELNLVNLEHIYPQRPTLPDPQLEPLKHDIGNLTFWGPNDNVAAANAPFATKKTLYSQSTVMLNRELANLPDWNVNELERRKDLLIAIAKSIFTA
jgi:hypothetical protein